MPIKAKCDGCGTGFKAKDSLAGKRVRCPKCKQPLTIPTADGESGGSAAAKKSPRAASASARSKSKPKASGRAALNPMMGLLDEANVKGVSRGPTCDNCAAELMPGAMICIECGYNQETGKQMSTEVDDDAKSTAGMSDADRLLAKAEKDIDESPVTAEGQDFGDGADSLVIAGVAGLILLALVGVGLVIIFSMETISQFTNPGVISMIAAIVMVIACGAWITIIAFKQKRAGHGLACLLTGFFWCIVYGFMQGKDLLIPTVVILISFFIACASGTYVGYNGWGPVTGE